MFGILPEEIDKMGQLLESEAPGNLRNIPVGMSQQNASLTQNPLLNQFGGGFTRNCFQRTVEMVHMIRAR